MGLFKRIEEKWLAWSQVLGGLLVAGFGAVDFTAFFYGVFSPRQMIGIGLFMFVKGVIDELVRRNREKEPEA